MGNRQEILNLAIARILNCAVLNVKNAVKSSFFKSAPWGYISNNDYLNIGLKLEINEKIAPELLLTSLQKIEEDINGSKNHRDVQGNYVDRHLDIDIIAVDDSVYESDKLILPHPRLHLRDFVLVPMNEIAPEWVHPIFHKTPEELLKNLQQVE